MNLLGLFGLVIFVKENEYYAVAVQLTSSADHLTVGANFTLTCKFEKKSNIVFKSTNTNECVITNVSHEGKCVYGNGFCNQNFIYSCNQGANQYALTIPASYNNDSYHNSTWICGDPFAQQSNPFLLMIYVPVTQVDLTPVQSVVVGKRSEFTCTTNPIRPSGSIQWYIGARNVTSEAVLQQPQPDGTKFISSSKLNYTGHEADNNKTIYCEAVNIKGSSTVKSRSQIIYVQVPITTLEILPLTDFTIVSEENRELTCTTNSGRPAAWIQWYIGTRNVTNDAVPQTPQLNGNKFISSSILNYTGNESDHNNHVYCEAVNIEGRTAIKSSQLKVSILLSVTSATITPDHDSNIINVLTGETREFTCTTDSSRPSATIQWFIDARNVTEYAVPQPPQSIGTKFISTSKLNLTGNEAEHNKYLYCEAVNLRDRPSVKTRGKRIYIQAPVNQVDITPVGDNSVVSIISGLTQTFTCTTGSSRPAAWIQWYIGTRNVTNDSVPQVPQPIGTMFQSSSKLNYTGNDNDHNNSVYCVAVNIDESKQIKSTEKVLYIRVPVTSASISPNGESDIANIVSGKTIEFTCSTDFGRPPALIQWYIGSRNVTNDAVSQQDASMISSSKLNYTGIETDHNMNIYCEAFNIDERQKVRSSKKMLYIQVPIKTVTIDSVNNQLNVVTGDTKGLTCTTNSGRPAAWIQWFIGTHNVTNDAAPQTPQLDGTKVISSSILNYTGNEADHNQTVHCEAVNIQGRPKIISIYSTLFIQVPVKEVVIKNNKNTVVAVSSRSTNFTCTAESGRPAAWVYWFIDDKNVTEYSTSFVEPNGLKFNTVSYLRYTGIIDDHGKILYCNADNIPHKANKISNVTIVINSSVVADGSIVSDVGVLENQGFNLSIRLIANPEPTIRWTFVNSSGFETTLDSSVIKTTAYDTFHHTTMYEKSSAAESDFGNYTIFASNSIGEDFTHTISVEPTLYVNSQGQTSIGSLVGGVSGSGFALIVIVVVTVFLFRRHRSLKGNDREHFRKWEDKIDQNDEDGLMENPLYATSVDTTIYTEVTKSKQTKKADRLNEEKEKEKIKKTRGKGSEKQHFEMDCVYENSDDLPMDDAIYNNVANNSTDNGKDQFYAKKKNKDGLIYADLEFASTGSQSQFVIRGFENKTSYAIIDLSRQAEPLPNSDDDDANEDVK